MSIMINYPHYNPYDNPAPEDYYALHKALGTQNVYSQEAYDLYDLYYTVYDHFIEMSPEYANDRYNANVYEACPYSEPLTERKQFANLLKSNGLVNSREVVDVFLPTVVQPIDVNQTDEEELPF